MLMDFLRNCIHIMNEGTVLQFENCKGLKDLSVPKIQKLSDCSKIHEIKIRQFGGECCLSTKTSRASDFLFTAFFGNTVFIFKKNVKNIGLRSGLEQQQKIMQLLKHL